MVIDKRAIKINCIISAMRLGFFVRLNLVGCCYMNYVVFLSSLK